MVLTTFLMFFQQQKIVAKDFSMFFFGCNEKRLFLTFSDYCNSLWKWWSLVKGHKNGSKWPKKYEILLIAKTSFQPSLSDFFFSVQTLLTTISYVFLRCNHRKQFFRTIAIVVANDDSWRYFAQVYHTI